MTVHNKDNRYSWSAVEPFTAEDGTAFTNFLLALNSGGCFAGQCGWRLPTIYELQTILLAPYLCAASPCTDPVFGPTAAYGHWSATTSATDPSSAWIVYFAGGSLYADFNEDWDYAIRAVRAGL